MRNSDSKLSNILKSLAFLKVLPNKYRKYKFVREYRERLNKDNPHKLTLLQRVWFNIEKNVFYKFLLAVSGILLSMKIIGFSSFNFLTLDNNSARYFFSTVAQSLAALFAISFTVLLIYLQISTDKYSIHTVKFVFEGWRGIIVINAFLITIISSLYYLGNISDSSGAIPYSGSGVFVIFSLLVLCSILLVEFFYRTILNLIPENFIRNSGGRIRRTFTHSLDFIQELRIKNAFIKERLKNLNIELSVFAEGKHPIKTTKRGFVSEVDVLKLEKVERLLSENPAEGETKNKVVLAKSIEDRLGAEKNILGYVEHPDKSTREEISDLIIKAYKNDERLYLLDYYQELTPLASLTTRAIKELEKGTVESSLEEFTDIGIEYLKARKNFGLMLHPEQTDGMKLGRHFFDEWIGHVEKMLDEALKQDDNDIVRNVIYRMRRVGSAAIEIQDLDAFKRLTGFFYYSYYRSLSYSILIGQDRVLYYLQDWFLKLKFDIEKEEVDYAYVKDSEFFFVEMVRTSTNIVKLLIDKENDKFIIKALDGQIAFLDMAHLEYDMSKYGLKDRKEKLSEDSKEYAEIENKLRVIELKEQMGKDLEKLIAHKLFMLGAYVMVRQEENAIEVRFSSKVFKELSRKLGRDDLERTFESLKPFNFGEEGFWFTPYREGGFHGVDTSYVPRFYLLFCSYLIKNGRKLENIKPVDYFTKTQIKEFEREFSKLLENLETWDAVFEGDAKKYLEQVIVRLRECQKEQEEKIRERVRKAELAAERVEKIKNDIIQHAEKSMEARAFVNVGEVPDAPEEDFSYFGIDILYDKIFFVEGVDKSTHYGYEMIGSQLGRNIGTGETNLIVGKIYTALNKTKNVIECDFTFDAIDRAVKVLEERGLAGEYALLLGSDLFSKIWELPEFKHKTRSGEENAPYGYIDNVAVYLIRIPDEKTAILLSQNIGTLFVKEKLIPEISVDFDKEKIKEEVKKLKEELEEKVNIKALERIKFDIENDEAGLILKFKTVT